MLFEWLMNCKTHLAQLGYSRWPLGGFAEASRRVIRQSRRDGARIPANLYAPFCRSIEEQRNKVADLC